MSIVLIIIIISLFIISQNLKNDNNSCNSLCNGSNNDRCKSSCKSLMSSWRNHKTSIFNLDIERVTPFQIGVGIVTAVMSFILFVVVKDER